jgi:hypothetical protein
VLFFPLLQAVTIYKSSNVTARYVTFVDSPQMHINFQYVASGHAKGLQVQAPWSSPNTDGIHISGTTDFTVQKCNVSTGTFLTLVSITHPNILLDIFPRKTPFGFLFNFLIKIQ